MFLPLHFTAAQRFVLGFFLLRSLNSRPFITPFYSAPLPAALQSLNQWTSQQKHLWSEHGADLGKQHVTGEGEQDVLSEGGEPHHPLEISRILKTSERKMKIRKTNYINEKYLYELWMFSHHFPPKVVPSRLDAGFERLPVHIGWKIGKQERRWEQETKSDPIRTHTFTFSASWYNFLFSFFLSLDADVRLLLPLTVKLKAEPTQGPIFFSLLCGINTDTWSPPSGRHNSESSPSHSDTVPTCILHIVVSVCV